MLLLHISAEYSVLNELPRQKDGRGSVPHQLRFFPGDGLPQSVSLPKPFFLTNLSSFGSNYLRSALKDDSGLVKETLCRWMFTTGNRDFRLVSMQGFDISFFLS